MAAEANLTKVINVRTKTVLYIPDFPFKPMKKEYPHEWFSRNKKKPSFSVKNGTLTNKLRGIVRGIIGRSKPSIDHVLLYLYLVLKEQTEELSEDWESYGLTIGKKGERISPMNLLEVERDGDLQDENFTQTNATSADDKWMTMWLLSFYRLDRASETNYKINIANNLSNQIMHAARKSLELSLLNDLTRVGSWLSNPNYCKIIAVVDMFFNRFKKNPWSDIRICTTGSRYKGCSALLSVAHACELMGMEKQADLLDWISNKTIADEIGPLLGGKDEYNDPFSYFPYQVDLGLVVRSAYSAKGNPAVHTFCHLIGLYYNNQRSINARHILTRDVIGVVHNAQWVGYAATIGRELGDNPEKDVELKTNQESSKSQGVQLDVAKLAISEKTFPEPTTKNANEWYGYMDCRNWALSRAMEERAIMVSKKMRNVRQGTIGSFAQTSAFIP